MNIDLLRELTEAQGVSGFEDEIREIVRRELGGLAELSADTMGNIIAIKRAMSPGGEPARKVMIAAHMDEIGFLVKFIDSSGFIRLQPLGGWDPRQMNSQRVRIRTAKGDVMGVLMYGTKPAHLLTEAETKEGLKMDNFFVDIGLSGDSAKSKISLGDAVTMYRPFASIGDLLTCKTMDDRVGLFVMIEAMKAVGEHGVDIYAVATVQEEIGLRGATAAGSAIKPDIVVALDITLANDIPGVPEQDQITKLGDGTAIKIFDSSLICHPKLVEHFKKVAKEHGIKHQMEILPRGGTDAGGIQRLNGGMAAITLSIPTRYVHTVNETVHPADVQASIDLLARYLEDAHTGDYSY